jgi:hydrogenase maturation factor HypF (carbamoyltransferase family)
LLEARLDVLLTALLADIAAGIDAAVVARRFHGALVSFATALAEHAGIECVALSGGCFQKPSFDARAASPARATRLHGFDRRRCAEQ